MRNNNYVQVQQEIYRSKQTSILVIFAGSTTLCPNKLYLFWFLDIAMEGRYTKFIAVEISNEQLYEILNDELTVRSLFLSNPVSYIFEVGSSDNFIYRQTPVAAEDLDFSCLPPEGIGINSNDRVNDKRNLN